jgi:hypothetical protein
LATESPEALGLKEQLVKKLCEINSVANSMGRGRDDLPLEILKAAEAVNRKISNT